MTSRSSRVFRSARASISRLLGAAGQGVEALEPRQLLSAEPLPLGASWTPWQGAEVAAVTGSYIVTFDEKLSAANAELMARDVARTLGIAAWNFEGLANGYNATFTTDKRLTGDDARRAMESLPGLRGVEPNRVFQSHALPNDPRFNEQWHLRNVGQPVGFSGPGVPDADIDAEQAWDITIGSRDVIVGIIDTGVQINHPDLADNIWINPNEVPNDGVDNDGNGYVDDVNGFDFGESDNNPDDNGGHGTPVAGLIGAVGNNGVGVTGVNWQVSLLPLKISNSFGGLSLAAIVQAHDYVTDMRNRGVNVAVTNNSYGAYGQAGDFYEDEPTGFNAERDAILRYLNSGGIFVASAGNGGFDGIGDDNDDPESTAFPASYNLPGIISVAAMDNADGLAGYSNFGDQTVDVAAPAVDTLTTAMNSGYTFFGGTSAAGPVVAGIAALIKAAKPTASAVEVRELLQSTSDPLPSLQGKVRSGGRVNAHRALLAATTEGPLVQSVTPGPITTQLDPSTGQPLTQITVRFSETISNDASFFNATNVRLRHNGADNSFGTGDDVLVPITSIVRSATDDRTAIITLNLAGFPSQRLPIEDYQLTLFNAGFRDISGNRLNGNTSAGIDDVRPFRVVNTTTETGGTDNDTLATATPVVFNASGVANVNSAFLGDGIAGALDVDIYRIDMSRGGLISAEITARRLPGGSTLDSYLRLFDGNGVEITDNDQFYGQDSAIDFYVSTAGTYYVAVSGFGNDDYDPTVRASGRAQSTGTYNLRISAQLSQDDTVLYTSDGNAPQGQPDLPFNIPRGNEPNEPSGTTGVTTAAIVVQDTRRLSDVNLRINAAHTAVGDLTISLIGPDNTTIRLYGNGTATPLYGFDQDNFGTRDGNGNPLTYTTFDDEAGTAISGGTAPYVGTFRPEQALSAYDGKVAAGLWTLRIVDNRPGDNGRLYDWDIQFTFQNNVFGPFESNDTIATATVINEFTGTGSATREAFIGDGGFGNLDRDIYRFVAEAGSTLSVNVTSQSALNTTLRLFDANGSQITISRPTDTRNSSIAGYVFPIGGTYYLAVSENANFEYNPAQVASGVPAATTGEYTITIEVAPGVSDPAVSLNGNRVDVGLRQGGLFTAGGLAFENFNILGPSDIDEQFFGATVGGQGFVNDQSGVQTPFAVNDESTGTTLRASTRGSFRGLSIERTFTYGANDPFIAVDVYLTNTTGAALTNVSWMEGFNPNPGYAFGEDTSITRNDVDVTGRVATATYVTNQFLGGFTVALAAPAVDPDGDVYTVRATVIDPGVVFRDSERLAALPANDPNGASGDGSLALSYLVPTIGTDEATRTVSFRYFIFFGASSPASPPGTPPGQNSIDQINAMLAQVNGGTGTGHLAAGPSEAATEQLDNSLTQPTQRDVRQYAYRLYYPEGFLGPDIFSFIPMSNPNDQTANFSVILRFENVPAGKKDYLIADSFIPARRRAGVDINRPETYDAGTFPNGAAIDADLRGKPYAIEIRSDQPIAATFSYYDLVQIGSGPVAVGESFTPIVSQQWTFADVEKNGGQDNPIDNVPADTEPSDDVQSYIVFYNPHPTQEAKVNVRVYGKRAHPQTGELIDATWISPRRVAPLGRSGLWMGAGDSFDLLTEIPGLEVVGESYGQIPNGRFGVFVDSDVPIVAAKSTYSAADREATGTVGNSSRGSTTGLLAEGQFGQRAESETLGFLNTNSTNATVDLSFLFENGSAYRTTLAVPANTHRELAVENLPNFPSGQAYSIFFTSNVAVSASATSPVEQGGVRDAFSASQSANAYTYWGFGEGFRPGDNSGHPGVIENLRLYNPSGGDITVEITFNYDLQPGTETFRRTLPARRVTEFNVDEFISGLRRQSNQSYGIAIKAPVPIVAEMSHYDLLFPGGFATLGTPLGRFAAIT
ncbi:MAG TPA: sensory rhodopsin transducer [Phycisphaerales bacterium]|nr:sensory rhodopsin transducer [Phycisphaerales bacterium]